MITALDIQGVTITGTRDTNGIRKMALRTLFFSVAKPFDSSLTTWYVGGAKGIDTEFLEWVVDNTMGRVHIVVPDIVKTQPLAARIVIEKALESDHLTAKVSLTELAGGQNANSYHARNRYMVDRSQAIIGFPHATQPSRGTYYTLRYAEQSRNLPRFIWPVGE
jgi:hypothetical protein